jgi:hypothetical protein
MSGNWENREGITKYGKIIALVSSKAFEQENSIPEATEAVPAEHFERSQKWKGSSS